MLQLWIMFSCSEICRTDKEILIMNYSKNGKPILRHCYNCEYGECHTSQYSYFPDCCCTVKFKGISFGRIESFLCRFYKVKQSLLDE